MKNEGKHDHKLTKLLKFSIFATLMLAPFIAISGQMAYTTFNKNAKDSYTQAEYSQEKDYLTQENTEDNIYFMSPNAPTINTAFNLYISNLTFTNQGNVSASTYNTIMTSNVTRLDFTTANKIDFYNKVNNVDNWVAQCPFTQSYELSFKVDTYQPTSGIDWTIFYTYHTTPHQTLDNAFYDAVEKVQQSNLFNWTTNTAIYNGINGMTTGLGIQTQAIPILLTYWIILTAVYVVFDIVIECFIWLTHIFNPSKLA